MTAAYRISPQAKSDLDQIWDYIAADNPAAATEFLSEIDDKILMLSRQPLIGEAREELAAGLRDFPVGNYVILYRVVDSGVARIEIVRVIHGARDIRRLL